MKKIMLVEDSADTKELIVMLVEMSGYQTECAETGSECFAKLKNFQPDLILMDVSLPGELNGLQIAAALRADRAYDQTPILAMTAHALPEDFRRSLAAGCDAHITKPIEDLEEFIKIVDRFAAEGRNAGDRAEQAIEN